MEYQKNKDVVADFRKRTEEYFHLVNDCSANDFEESVYNYINSYIEEYSPGTEIIDVVLTGSRSRGIETSDSDMDFVFAYEGEMKEDEMFNLLNKGELMLAGIKIDINPIRPEETGSMEEYLIKAEKYLLDKAEKMNMTLYTKWQDIAISQGYPLIVGKETVVFPAEYDAYFTSQKLKRLEKIMLDNMNKPKVKDYTTIKEEFKAEENRRELAEKLKDVEAPTQVAPKL